jgi:hypothetical protein
LLTTAVPVLLGLIVLPFCLLGGLVLAFIS